MYYRRFPIVSYSQLIRSARPGGANTPHKLMTALSFVLICLADFTDARDVGVEQGYIIEERLQVPVREADQASEVAIRPHV